MSVRILESTDSYGGTNQQVVYFSKEYLASQKHAQIFIAESDQFLLPISIQGSLAISISRSPFGSLFIKKNYTQSEFKTFMESVVNSLKQLKVEKIQLKHPPAIYGNFSNVSDLTSSGFKILYKDINQHISLAETWESSIHAMQKRKLRTLLEEGFSFQQTDDFETAYKFINVCRQTQGLQVNIGWDHLHSLIEGLPGKYQCFTVQREDKLSAVCIAVQATPEVAYYYLPATSPLFRSHSPMVLLIAGMVNYYRSQGFKYLDLGVSSLEGRPQETLQLFKERMGGEVNKKPFLELSL